LNGSPFLCVGKMVGRNIVKSKQENPVPKISHWATGLVFAKSFYNFS